jgi:CheY-like chemotaxis protein
MKAGKILIVDDEPAERDGLARLVGQWGTTSRRRPPPRKR